MCFTSIELRLGAPTSQRLSQITWATKIGHRWGLRWALATSPSRNWSRCWRTVA